MSERDGGEGSAAPGRADADPTEDDPTSTLFTYVAPFVGVLLIAVGIAGAVPGGYALVQDELRDCGTPTIVVESPERSEAIVGDGAPRFTRLSYGELGEAEADAFTEALTAPRGEAHVDGPFPNRAAFENGTVITYEGREYYSTIVAENTCFTAPPLGFPLGVFAIGLGTVSVLMPPVYRKLVALERESTLEPGAADSRQEQSPTERSEE